MANRNLAIVRCEICEPPRGYIYSHRLVPDNESVICAASMCLRVASVVWLNDEGELLYISGRRVFPLARARGGVRVE